MLACVVCVRVCVCVCGVCVCVCMCVCVCVCVYTVPYEGDNFANSKMDHFSLIIDRLNFLKTDWNFFYVYAKQESIYKSSKKAF